MASLSTRSVSLSDHFKRRKTSGRTNNCVGCGASGSSTSTSSGGGGTNPSCGNIGSASIINSSSLKIYSPQHHTNNDALLRRHPPPPPPPPCDTALSSRSSEGGYDSHVASYGNYDAPSTQHRRSYRASEHGCYAAESHIIGGGVDCGSVGRRIQAANANDKDVLDNNTTFRMARLGSYSNPLLDLEEQRYICSMSRQRRTPRGNSSLQQPPPSTGGVCVPQGRGGGISRVTWEGCVGGGSRTFSHDPRCQGDSSSCCSNAPTASTVGSSGSSSSSSSYSHHSIDTSSIAPLDEDAIRQGIIDFSTLVATYLAGALSFIIGIFLTLFSPLVKIIKCVVGDVMGLLGDAGFLYELGNLWRLYRDLRRSSERSHYSSTSNGDDHHYNNGHHHPRYQDDASLEDGSTTVCSADASTQFVGGWRPHVCPSVGSGCASSVNTPNSMEWTGTPRSSLSSSWAGGMAANASLRSGQGGQPGEGVVPPSRKIDEVSSCPPNMMMRHPQRSQSSESSPYHNSRNIDSCPPNMMMRHPQRSQSSESSPYHNSRNLDAYVRRQTDSSHYHQPQLPPRIQNNGYSYHQAPTHRYPRAKNDVVT